MSKKISEGINGLCFRYKNWEWSFLKTIDEGRKLAKLMKDGKQFQNKN